MGLLKRISFLVWLGLQLLAGSCGYSGEVSTTGAIGLTHVFERLELVECSLPTGTRDCTDEHGRLLIVPGASFIFLSDLDVDDTVRSVRTSFADAGCEDLMPEYAQRFRYISTWRGPLYSDPFDCAGIPVVFGNRIRADYSSEYELTVYRSEAELRQHYSSDFNVSEPRR